MPPTASDLSVIVCVYTDRRWDDILAAVGSLQAQQPPPGEILLVVDHNPLLEQRLQDRYEGHGDVRVAHSTGPQGLSGARNTGVGIARGSVLAFLDDDAAAEPGWAAGTLVAYADDLVLGIGGVALPGWPQTGRPRWFPPEFDWVVGCSYTGLPTTVAPVRNFIGASMSLRRSAFDAAGLFTDGMGRVGTLPLGCEETELCIRVRQRVPGAQLLHVPSVRVRHRVTPDRTKVRYFLRRCWAEGLSKAMVSRLVGAGDALSSERSYVTRTLPRGMARHLLTGGPAGVLRALAIAVGALVTAAGYTRGLAVASG